MAVFDPKQVIVLLDGKEIQDWADGSDVISAVNQVDAGQMVIGANGTGVFIANPDNSGKLTLKLKQHSEDNAYLSKLFNQQKSSIKTFIPFTLAIISPRRQATHVATGIMHKPGRLCLKI